ncbi:response regulator [Flavobacteriaceae bacterium R38]|nr:response regulator [Flavobacteriaceae bacterium R38]
MNVILIEDELPAREKLISFLDEYDSSIEISGVSDSITTSTALLKECNPDLIFADIELLDGTVFSLFKEIKVTTPIIFTTSYDDFLLDAFNTSGIAYLLKPFSFQQFKNAMDKYKSLTEKKSRISDSQLEILHKTFSARNYKKRFTSKVKDTIYIIETKDISSFNVEDGVIVAITKPNKSFILNEVSLKSIEEALDPSLFFKANRSEIVNINFIEKVKRYDRDRLIIYLKGGQKTIITSSRNTAAFRDWLST